MRFSWQSNINMSSKKSDIIGVLLVISMNYNKAKLNISVNPHLLPDLYGIVENWKSDVKLMPDFSWGDMYNCLVNSSSEYTQDNLKAYKSLEAFNVFVYNHGQGI